MRISHISIAIDVNYNLGMRISHNSIAIDVDNM